MPYSHLFDEEMLRMTPDERKKLIRLIWLIGEKKLAEMPPEQLQVAKAKLMGVKVNDPNLN